MRYFKNGAFMDDPWAAVTLLTPDQWLANEDGPLPQPLGLRLEPGFAVETIAADAKKFDLIAIAFPKFTDGRGYSMARLLRTHVGYTGELRAVGDVLFDEMQFMVRCGFNAFEIKDEGTLRLLQEGRRAAAFDHFYQPGLTSEIPEGTRPWARVAASL